jgi:hypothetical protein
VIDIHIRTRGIRVTPDLDELRRHRPYILILTYQKTRIPD